jgi:hypothetical protein
VTSDKKGRASRGLFDSSSLRPHPSSFKAEARR